MKLARGITMGAWLLVGLNLLMAFGAIAVLERMAPAVADILKKNEASIFLCQKMKTALLENMLQNKPELLSQFKENVEQAKKNITEEGEQEMLTLIEESCLKAFSSDPEAVKTVVNSIDRLIHVNRTRMYSADSEARHLGRGGAWGMAFMAFFTFVSGLAFVKIIRKKLLDPLNELKTAISEVENGDSRRRCSGADLPDDFRELFGSVNTLIDHSTRTSGN